MDLTAKSIIISPFSARYPDGQASAKNYGRWNEVIKGLKARGYFVIQIGVEGEPDINADQRFNNLNFKSLISLLNKCHTWIASDNFFPHFAHYYGKKGIVLWGRSDPLIFGYPENINLLKSRSNLREEQFKWWRETPHDNSVFVDAKQVLDALDTL